MRQYQNYSIRYENTMLCNRDLQKTAVTLVPWRQAKRYIYQDPILTLKIEIYNCRIACEKPDVLFMSGHYALNYKLLL